VASWSAASLYFNHARYDELGRLKTAGAVSYTYDGFGNRLTQTAPSMNLAYNASNNRITSAGYTYDANGNVTATPELTLAYDVENRLVEAVHATNGTERYAYAPNGQRVWKSGWQGGIYFYGVDGKVLGLYRLTEVYYGEPGTEPVWYDVMQEQGTNVYLGGRMVRGRNYSVVEDRLGTVNGPAMNPYGDGQVFEGYGFTGYYHDGITGFDYAQQRYYAPALGRFTTPDPYQASAAIARPQSWNRYAYVENDPVNFVDPGGEADFEVTKVEHIYDPVEGYYYKRWMNQFFAAQIIAETQPVYLVHQVGGRRPLVPPSKRRKEMTTEDKTKKLSAAKRLADKALQPGSDCWNLFNTNALDGEGVDPDVLLTSLITGGEYGSISYGVIDADSSAITVPMNNTAVITLNDSYNGLWALESDEGRALTLLHELGHAYHVLWGTDATAIVPDGRRDDPQFPALSITNSAIVEEKCLKGMR